MIDATAGVPPAGIRSRVLRGLVWKFSSQVVLQVARIAVALILARLLAPHDYGLAAMALVVMSFVLVFSDLALGAALVQRPELTEEDRSTAFWTGIATGLFFTAVGIAVAGPVSSFYNEPKVRALIMVLSTSFFITSLGATQRALLTREMQFRSLELRQMAGAVGGGGVGIGIAVAGFGAWAIVAQQVTMAIVSTLLLWLVSPWRPQFAYSLASLRKLGSFSVNVFGQRFLYQGARSADNLLIGRFLGPAAAGAYALSYNVMLAPLSRLGAPVSEVLFPALARIQDDRERVGSIWLRVNRVTAAVSVPALLGLIVVADDFVRVVLGPRWHAAIPVVRVLAWVGILQAVQNLNEDIFQALDRTGTMLAYMVLWSGGGIAAVVIGLHWGIVGVAVCFAIANTFLAPLYVWLTARVAGIPTWTFVVQLRGVAQASAAMAVAVYLAKMYLISAGVPAAARLVILSVFGLVAYLPLAAWRAPDLVADVRRLKPSQATSP